MKTRAYVHSSNVVSARALENVVLKRVISAAVSIATLIWHDLEPNMHAGQAISRAHGKSNSLFPVKFCYILRACLTKKSVIYVQNTSPERSGYNDVARRLFTSFKKMSVLSISEYLSISVFSKFVVNLPITFAVCKFARTSQIWR